MGTETIPTTICSGSELLITIREGTKHLDNWSECLKSVNLGKMLSIELKTINKTCLIVPVSSNNEKHKFYRVFCTNLWNINGDILM